VLDELLALMRARTSAEGAAWLDSAVNEVRAGRADLAALFPAVSRHVGRGPLGAPSPRDRWRIDDAARAALLLALRAANPPSDGRSALAAARDLYFAGDAREKIGALRALPLLGDDDTALPAALDAVRVNQGEIFEAAVLDNAYVSRHLPQLEFRKAALKCVFVGLPLGRIVGLAERADVELCRSLVDYVLEREAASRSVPPEIWRFAAIHPAAGLVAKLIGYLEHPDARHRAAAGRALIAIGDGRATPFLADRAEREPDPAVRAALHP
jgi:hypothetical protein